jgi:carbonic anhydrase
MRSIALACAIKGGREIAIIGHTDCKVRETTISQLIDRFKALGIERHLLPENLTEYFGVFASEQQNVIRGVDLVRRSPLIGPKIPVHGLMVDTATGKLDWIVNGYEVLDRPTSQAPPSLNMPSIGAAAEGLISRASAELSGLKVAEAKIGDAASRVSQWVSQTKTAFTSPSPPPALKGERLVGTHTAAPPSTPPSSPPPKVSPPPPIHPQAAPATEPRRTIPVPPRIEPPPRTGSSRRGF